MSHATEPPSTFDWAQVPVGPTTEPEIPEIEIKSALDRIGSRFDLTDREHDAVEVLIRRAAHRLNQPLF